jgi:hypothetical protein
MVGVSNCRRIVPVNQQASVDVRVPLSRELIVGVGRAGSARVFLRRFARSFQPLSFAQLGPGQFAAMRVPVDRAPELPWHVQFNTTAPLQLCLR